MRQFFGKFDRAYLVRKGVASEVVIRDQSDAVVLGTNQPPAATSPTVTTQPTISGNATTGSVLTLNEGAASGNPAPTSAIQWLRGTTAISGATGPTYTLVASDEGQPISARVTWTNSAGSVHATSNAITGQAAPPQADVQIAPINPNAWLAYIGQEQSEGMGPSLGNATLSPTPPFYTAGNSAHYARNLTPQARMLDGLRRPDGVAVSIINAPVGGGYNEAVAATGTKAANMNTAVMAHFIFAELARRGVFANDYFPQFHNAAGQDVWNLDNDPATGPSNATTLFNNFRFHTEQLKAQADAAGRPVRMLFALNIQGSANNGSAANVWINGRDAVDAQQRAVLAANGIPSTIADFPTLVMQTAAYTNTSGVDSLVCLEQLAVGRRPGSIFAGPMHQFKNADNQVHPGLEETARASTLLAWAYQANLLGQRFNLYSVRHQIVGNQIIIWYPIRPGETFRSINTKFDAYGGNANHGFEAPTGRSIVSQEPGQVVGYEASMVVTLDGPATGAGVLKLGRQKADVRAFADAAGSNYGAHRVGWATTDTSESVIYPGIFAERVLPSEEWTL